MAHAGDSERYIFDSFPSAISHVSEPSESEEVKEVTGYSPGFRRHYFRQRRQCIAGLRRNMRRRQAEQRRGKKELSYVNQAEPSKTEIALQDEEIKSSHMSNEPSTPFMDRGVYLNQAGDVIIDARLLKNLYMNEKTVTCTVCHKKVNLKNVYSHYKDTKHRFFTKIKLARDKK